jgi:integrase
VSTAAGQCLQRVSAFGSAAKTSSAPDLSCFHHTSSRTRKQLGLPNDAGLHALRHTFLTRAGKLTQNVKALQLLAGHAQVTTT